jgi:hypothetical protein
MPARNLRVVRLTFPMTGICEYCTQPFLSREENLDEARKQLLADFEAHTCKLMDSSRNALRIVRESTDGK